MLADWFLLRFKKSVNLGVHIAMTDHQGINRYYSGAVYRIFSLLFGLFLTGVGIYVVFFGVVDPLIRMFLGFLITLFGVNTVWSAIQARASWLAKLGPFF